MPLRDEQTAKRQLGQKRRRRERSGNGRIGCAHARCHLRPRRFYCGASVTGDPHSRVLKGAKIVVGKSSVIDCAVRNVTNSGARVQIANTVDLPDDLGLTFDGGRSFRPCRVVWRSVTETGLEFIQIASNDR
jgi:hypothetical protein